MSLQNHEFGEISTREIELAKYLDSIERVHVLEAEYIDDTLSFAHIVDKSQIGVVSAVNDQSSKTPLHIANS